MKSILTALIALLTFGRLYAADLDPYEEALFRLKEGSKDQDIKQALQFLEAAKEKAFPSLLRHLDSEEFASARHFQQEFVEVDTKTGKQLGLHHPRIGEVAFDLIQCSIEGNWPKNYRSLYVITVENVRDWLKHHENVSLREMQIAAAKEALAKAESDGDPTGLDFVRNHARKVLAGAPPDE